MLFILAPAAAAWRKLFSCSGFQRHPGPWGERRASGLCLLEYRREEAHSPEADAGFAAGLLYERSGGFAGEYLGSPVLLIDDAIPGRWQDSKAGEDPAIADSVRIGGERYYPDIILGHSFAGGHVDLAPDEMTANLYRQLNKLLPPHLLLLARFTPPQPDRKPMPDEYRRANELVDYLIAIDELDAPRRSLDMQSGMAGENGRERQRRRRRLASARGE